MEGYTEKKYSCPTKRYVQFLELHNNEEAMKEYRKWHSKEYHWAEIRDGIRKVGILEMEIYVTANKLVMIVDAPMDFNWEKAMQKLATLPRQAEWEAFVSKFQGCSPDAKSEDKWQMMERMFYLYE